MFTFPTGMFASSDAAVIAGVLMTKTAGDGWGNAGASSVTTIAGDGWVEYTTPGASSNVHRQIGLSPDDTDQNYTDVAYSGGTSASFFEVYENGASRGTWATYENGALFRVRRVGTTVTYEKWETGAWVIKYTSASASTGAVRIDTSIWSNGGQLGEIKLFDNGVQVAITWQNVVGVTIA